MIYLFKFLQIDSARKHGFLLEAIQVLTDLNLSIKKAYICSDGRWFMDGELLTCAVMRFYYNILKKDILNLTFRFFFNCFAVFHVTDMNGNKLTDESVLGCIEQVVIIVTYCSIKF